MSVWDAGPVIDGETYEVEIICAGEHVATLTPEEASILGDALTWHADNEPPICEKDGCGRYAVAYGRCDLDQPRTN